MKRPSEETYGYSPPQKKAKHTQSSTLDDRQQQQSNGKYEDYLKETWKPKSGPVPTYIPFTVSSKFPPLPPVKDEEYSSALWTHKSTTTYNRSASSSPDITYEKLEFLGDAQIEHIASRLLYDRFAHLAAGQMSQLRELLVKNETLAEYSRAYGFDKRVDAGHMEINHERSKHKGNKGFNKVLGDVFEAYVAAVVLSDAEEGFAVAEKWLTALWALKLTEAAKKDRNYSYKSPVSLTHDDKTANPLHLYNPTAKQDLQKRISAPNIKLAYESWKATVELKGDQLGQNRHFIALYLTGYGYERTLLGKGEGRNKVEAGNWAATQAMFGECGGVVDECEQKLLAMREEKKKKGQEKLEGGRAE